MKRTLSIALSVALCLAMIAPWGVAGAEGELRTITGWGAFSFNDQSGIISYADQLAWKAIADRLGIQVKWTVVSGTDRATQFSLVMSSGDLPDFFVDLNPLQYEEFGRMGALLPLNDQIANMPNLSALLANDAEALPSITSADGNVYFFPRLLEPAARYWPGLFIREDYLEQAGIAMPETTDEYHAALKAIKETVATCEKPLTGGMGVLKSLVWAFGVGARGMGSSNTDDAFIEDGQVKFGPNDARYREALKYLNALYEDGLIDPEWNTVTGDQVRTNIITGVSASTSGSFSGVLSTYNSLLVADGQGDALSPIAPLAGPGGERNWMGHHTSIDMNYGAAITSTSEHVSDVVELFDYTYSDEGRTLIYWGVEGETYELVDGKPAFTEKVTSSELGVLTYLNNYSANTSCYPSALITEFYHATLSDKARQGNLAETEIDQAIDKKIPSLRYTAEEISQVNAILTDLSAYVDECFSAFVTGSRDIDSDSEWESYLAGFDGLRLNELMGYYAAAYERFQAAVG